jgi:hypothetical protein
MSVAILSIEYVMVQRCFSLRVQSYNISFISAKHFAERFLPVRFLAEPSGRAERFAEVSAKNLRNLNFLKRKTSFPFAFLSFLRNFGFAELTLHSEMKRKTSFPFAFLSFLRNFAAMIQD